MEFEYIEHRKGLPFKLFLVSIGYRTHHFHSELEIIYVLKGKVQIQVAQAFHLLEAGQLFLMNPYEIHSIEGLTEENLEDNVLLIIQITTHAHALNKKRLSQIHFTERLIASNTQALSQLMFHLYLKSFDALPSTDYYLNGLIQLYLASLLDGVPYTMTEQGSLSNQSDDFKRLQYIIDYVEAHHKEKIYLDDLAQDLHLNKYYLSHFVRQHLGINFQTLVNNVRLTSAISLLINTELSILDLSIQSGFSDQKYLNQMIKDKYNCTANALRKTIRKHSKTAVISAPIGSLHLPFDLEDAVALIQSKQQHCPIISTTS